MKVLNNGVGIDLNPQNVHFRYGNTELSTRMLVISGPREEKAASKDGLFALEQGRIDYWSKNDFLSAQTSIAVTGLENVNIIVRDTPDVEGETFQQWFLGQKMCKGNRLVTSTERSTRGSYLFVVAENHRGEAENFIDSMSEKIWAAFEFDLVTAIDLNQTIKRKYRFMLSKITGQEAVASNSVMNQIMSISANASPLA
eukprot:13622075-Ditylum_brightwellii.AAC.1